MLTADDLDLIAIANEWSNKHHDYTRACRTLDQVTDQDDPLTLKARCLAATLARDWPVANAAMENLEAQAHRDICADVLQTHLLHFQGRTQDAYLILADRLPASSWHIPWLLAVCSVRLDRLDEAKHWFLKAIALDCVEVCEATKLCNDLDPMLPLLSLRSMLGNG